MTMRLIGLALGIAAVFPASAYAAAEDIEIAPEASFVHQQTGISLPAMIGEAERDRLIDYSEGSRNNIGTTYVGPDGRTITSIYLYRPAITDISLTTDVVMSFISSQHTPEKGAELTPVAFAPQGREIADSLMVTFDVTAQGQYPVGGVALVPFDDWLIKVRISSDLYSAKTLPALIRETVQKLRFPKPQQAAPAAGSIGACTTRMTFNSATLIDAQVDGVMASALGLMLFSMGKNDESDTAAVQWCRDDSVGHDRVYRQDEAQDRYVVALTDSGNYLEVGSPIASLLAELNGDLQGSVPLLFSTSDRTSLLGVASALPHPDDVDGLLDGAQPLASTDRAGGVSIDEATFSAPQ